MKLRFRHIDIKTDDYIKELELRDLVLRIPLGLSIKDDPLHEEVNDYHLGCFVGDQLVGILLLRELDETTVKMRQVGVNPKYQGLGIGKKLVKYGEEQALKLGYNKITLHGRKHVESFYKKLDYTRIGKEFVEVGIKHIKMIKDLEVL